MRLDNVTSAATRICYVTEGVLLRRMLADPDLDGVSAIVFDEFHERHLYGDITLARALQIQESTRPDLIIIVMSATLDVATVEKYLQPCAVLSSQGRTYPVTTEYLSKPAGNAPVWDLAVRELQRLVREHPQGDALIFMPGAYEIARTVQAARDALGLEFVVFPLHGELPPRDQDAAVAKLRPAQSRRRDQRRGNFAHHRWRASGDRQRLGAHSALRSVSRHQHVADRKNQPRRRRSARRSRRPHRAGPLLAPMDRA